MLYQIERKNVKKEPKGDFKKKVVKPRKLKNFITEEGKKEVTSSFWIEFSFKALLKFIFIICRKSGFWMHIAIVKDSEDDHRLYINGEELKG